MRRRGATRLVFYKSRADLIFSGTPEETATGSRGSRCKSWYRGSKGKSERGTGVVDGRPDPADPRRPPGPPVLFSGALHYRTSSALLATYGSFAIDVFDLPMLSWKRDVRREYRERLAVYSTFFLIEKYCQFCSQYCGILERRRDVPQDIFRTRDERLPPFIAIRQTANVCGSSDDV